MCCMTAPSWQGRRCALPLHPSRLSAFQASSHHAPSERIAVQSLAPCGRCTTTWGSRRATPKTPMARRALPGSAPRLLRHGSRPVFRHRLRPGRRPPGTVSQNFRLERNIYTHIRFNQCTNRCVKVDPHIRCAERRDQ